MKTENHKPAVNATGPCRPSTNGQNDLFGTSGALSLSLGALLSYFFVRSFRAAPQLWTVRLEEAFSELIWFWNYWNRREGRTRRSRCHHDRGHRDVTANESRKHSKFSKIAPLPLPDTTFWSGIYPIIPALNGVVFESASGPANRNIHHNDKPEP